MEACHLSSMSRMVASWVDFLAGMAAAGEALGAGVALGLLLAAGGDESLVAAGELAGFGLGEASFSVLIDTLGSADSVFSETVISGDTSGAGVAVSSWASANGTAAAISRVMARMVFFIGFVLCGVLAAESPERGLKCSLFERGRILFGREIPRQGRFGTPMLPIPVFLRKTIWP